MENMPGMDMNMPGMNMGPTPTPATTPAGGGGDMPGMDMGSSSSGGAAPYCSLSKAQHLGHRAGFGPVGEAQTLRPCLTFLFTAALIDTPGKYACAVVGAFLIAFTAEVMQYLRSKARRRFRGVVEQRRGGYALRSVLESLLFGIQMLCSYACMLLVMSYDTLIASAVVLGLVFGYFLTLILKGREDGCVKEGAGQGGEEEHCDGVKRMHSDVEEAAVEEEGKRA